MTNDSIPAGGPEGAEGIAEGYARLAVMADRDALDITAERRERHHVRPLTTRRVLVRFAVALLALVALDVALGRALPTPDFERELAHAARAAHLAGRSLRSAHRAAGGGSGDEPIVAFTGASPTWGDAVTDRRKTVPAWFARAAEASGTPARVYNLASNGQLLGDQYFIAKRISDDADVVFVQLTYHGFNRAWREGATRRYPELPRLLGIPVDAGLADILGAPKTPRTDVTGTIDRALMRYWRLYGARDEIAGRVLGTTPESTLFDRWQRLTMPGFMGEQERAPSGQRFDELDPEAQMLVMDEFSAAGDYAFDPRDSEVRMLERLAADLEKSGTRAVFYISPLNVEALDSYELFDEKRYAENVAPLRSIVESHGHRFLDLNTGSPLPSSAFADVNHTTAAGSELVARKLWEQAGDEVTGR